jgi:hypothetical protein
MKLSFASLLLIAAIITTLGMAAPHSRAATVIAIPFSGEGNSASIVPFSPETFGHDSIRFQQVYGASGFSALGIGGGFITDLYFSVDAAGRGFGATLPSIEILMSTTLRNPDELSTSFADNLGLETAKVYSRGPLTLFAFGPSVIDVHISLQTPYFYDPADGNLLLEIRNYMKIGDPPPPFGGRVQALDASLVLGDSVSRVYAYDVGATVGTADTLGLQTYFAVTPVPEPSTWVMLSGLIVVSVLWQRWRKLVGLKG